jgi:hypothetical protein
MLAPSAMIIPNKKTSELCIDIATRSLAIGEFTDLIMAIESSNHIFLTPKDGPYFYQNNYNESVTRFFWKDYLDKYCGPGEKCCMKKKTTTTGSGNNLWLIILLIILIILIVGIVLYIITFDIITT